jgi:hypothetical protein
MVHHCTIPLKTSKSFSVIQIKEKNKYPNKKERDANHQWKDLH